MRRAASAAKRILYLALNIRRHRHADPVGGLPDVAVNKLSKADARRYWRARTLENLKVICQLTQKPVYVVTGYVAVDEQLPQDVLGVLGDGRIGRDLGSVENGLSPTGSLLPRAGRPSLRSPPRRLSDGGRGE